MREAVPAGLVRHWQTSAASAGEDAWRVSEWRDGGERERPDHPPRMALRETAVAAASFVGLTRQGLEIRRRRDA